MLKAAIALLVCLMAVSSVYAEPGSWSYRPADQQQGAQTGYRKNQPADAHQHPTQQPIVINIVAAPKSAADSTQEQQERDRKAKLDERLVELTAELSSYTGGLYRATVGLVIATGLLVICTAVLVVFGYRQLRDAKRSIHAAQTAADAATKSADGFVNAERPHISLTKEPVGFNVREINPVGRYALRFPFKNYGRTPAFVRRVCFYGLIQKDEPLEPDDAKAMVIKNVLIVGPNEIKQYPNTRLPMQEDARAKVISGELTVYFIGFFEYIGAFQLRDKNAIPHISGFAYKFKVGTDPSEDKFVSLPAPAFWKYT